MGELRKVIEFTGMLCPVCKSNVMVEKHNTLRVLLDYKGYPISHYEEIDNQLIAECTKCDFKTLVIMQGLQFVPYSREKEIIDRYIVEYKEQENPFGW